MKTDGAVLVKVSERQIMPEAFTETSDTKCEASTCPRGAVFVQWPMVTILNGTRMFHAMHLHKQQISDVC